MKLIYEIDSNADVHVSTELNEASGKEEKKYKIQGIFSTINERNRNGRIYPKKIWESEVQKYQDVISSGSHNTLMEWEHPARTNVDPMEAVAKINKLYIQGKYVMGEAVLLDNPKANQIKSLIENGIKVSVSSRGVGNVKNGIVEDFKLVTYDLVSDPSDYNATMNGIVESYQLNEGVLQDKTFKQDEFGNIIEISDEPAQEEHVPETCEVKDCEECKRLQNNEIPEQHNPDTCTEKNCKECKEIQAQILNDADSKQIVEAFLTRFNEILKN